MTHLRSPHIPLLLLGLLSVSLLSAGCGQAPCQGRERSGSDGAPLLRVFEFHDQPDYDPWLIVFAADFEDTDADLGDGQVDIFLDDGDPVSLDLGELFRLSEVDEDAASGRFAVPLRFSGELQDGQRVSLAAQLVDEDNRRSNCYELELEFNLQSAP